MKTRTIFGRALAFFAALIALAAARQAEAATYNNYWTRGYNSGITDSRNWGVSTSGRYPSAGNKNTLNLTCHTNNLIDKAVWSSRLLNINGSPNAITNTKSQVTFWGGTAEVPWILRGDAAARGWYMGTGGIFLGNTETGTHNPNETTAPSTEESYLYITGGQNHWARNMKIGGLTSANAGHFILTDAIIGENLTYDENIATKLHIDNILHIIQGDAKVEAISKNVVMEGKYIEVANNADTAAELKISGSDTASATVKANDSTFIGKVAGATGTLSLENNKATMHQSAGYLFLGGTTSAAGTGYLYADGGTVKINGSTSPNLVLGGPDGRGEVHATNATFTVANNIVLCWGDGATGIFDSVNNKIEAKSVFLGGQGSGTNGKADTHAVFRQKGGTTTTSSNTEIGCFNGSTTGGYAWMALDGRATYDCGGNVQLMAATGSTSDRYYLTVTNATLNVGTADRAQHIYQNGGTGEMAIGQDGIVLINGNLATSWGARSQVGGDFTVRLGTGGTLAMNSLTVNANNNANPNANVIFAFEGGTVKANANNTAFIPSHEQLTVTVNAAGGKIDANGKDVTIPASLTAATGVATPGDITVLGANGGSVEFTGNVGFGGNIAAQFGTTLKLNDTAANSLLDNGVLKIKPVILKDGTLPTSAGEALVQFTETAPTDAMIAGMEILFDDGTAATDYEVYIDGQDIKLRAKADPTWTGAADGVFSNPANWLNSKLPVNGAIVHFAPTADVTANNDMTGLSVDKIVFDGPGAATITGNTITVTDTIVNNTAAEQTITAPVSFTGNPAALSDGTVKFTSLTTPGKLVICDRDNSTGIVTVDGGPLTVGNALYLGGNGNDAACADTHAELYLTGGATGSTPSNCNTEIGYFAATGTTGGYALFSLNGGATFNCGLNVQLMAAAGTTLDRYYLAVTNATMNITGSVFQNGGTGEMSIGDGGTVNINGEKLATAWGARSTVGGDFTVRLGTGGTLAMKTITANAVGRNADCAVTFAFEGGTVKATATDANARNNFITNHTQLAVTVNAAGGIINANAKDIKIPAALTAATGVVTPGDITVKGGGSVEFTNDIGFGGNIAATFGTILKLNNTAAASLLVNDALKIKAVIPKAGTMPSPGGDILVQFTGSTVPTDAMIANVAVVFDDGTAATDYEIYADGQYLKLRDIAEPTWIANTDGDFSNAENWLNGKLPAAGYKIHFAPTADVTANNDMTGLSVNQIIFDGENSTKITGNAITVTDTIVNNTAVKQFIAAEVTSSLSQPRLDGGPIAIDGTSSSAFFKANRIEVGTVANQPEEIFLAGENAQFGATGSYIRFGYGENAIGRIFADGGKIFTKGGSGNFCLGGANGATGEAHLTNATLTVTARIAPGYAAGSTGILDAKDCTITAPTNVIGFANNTICRETISGGTMTISQMVLLGGNGSGNNGRADTRAELFITDGATASSGSNTEIGCFNGSTTGGYAWMALDGRATYDCGGNIQLMAATGTTADRYYLTVTNATLNVNGTIYQNGGTGEMSIGDGGTVTINGSRSLATAWGDRSTVGGDFTVRLGTGGTLAMKTFTVNANNNANPNANVCFAFEGGTVKADADNTEFLPSHEQLTVTVNAAGGKINANGKDVTIPAALTAATGAQSIGDLKVQGGGSVEFTGDIGFGGNIAVTFGTTLKLNDAAAASITANGALKIKAVIPKDGTQPQTGNILAQFTETAPTDAQIAGIDIVYDDGTDASDAFGLYIAGNNIQFRDLSIPTWTGSANGNFSDPANWKNNKVPVSGSDAIFEPGGDVTVFNNVEGLTLGSIEVIGEHGVTINGNPITVSGSIANESGKTLTIGAQVTFTGDITTRLSGEGGKVVYSGGVTGAKIAYTTEAERHLYGDYTLTTTDTWPDTTGSQYNLSSGVQWWIHGTLRVANANLRNCTIESGAKVFVETAKMDRYQFVERVVGPKGNIYYALLTRANHGLYSIGKIETSDAIELSPAYSAEDYEGGMTIAGGIEYIGMGPTTGSSAFTAKVESPFAFHLSPGHRVTSGLRAGVGAAAWAIGASGLALTSNDSPNGNWNAWYRIDGDTTLKSTADWTLAENPANIPPYEDGGEDSSKCSALNTWRGQTWVANQTVASLSIDNGATLTIDTSHYATDGETGVAGHIVTLEGQVAGGADTKVAVTGDGTLVWDARAAKFTGAISVANGATLKLAGCAYGFKWLDGFTLDGTLVIDPIRKPVSVDATPVFGANAKIKLDADFDGTTLGKFVLMTWTESDDGEGGTVAATIPAGLLDASNLGAAGALSVETAPDGASKQLVLRVGDYEADAKPIRILAIGDSITQGVSGRNVYDDHSQYRTTIASYLAARGYKPQMLGHWKLNANDSADVLQPEEWTWHSGISGDSIVASANGTTYTGGALDNLHLYLDAAGYPDVVTVLIGTNDMGQQGKATDVVYPTWKKLLETIAAERPDAKIFAGTILDRASNAGVTKKTRAFNVLARADTQLPSSVTLVELQENVPATMYVNMMADSTHPQWNGLSAMGRLFADAITNGLPQASFTPTTDSTVTDTAQTALGAAAISELDAYREGFTHAYTIDFAATNGFFRNGSAPYTWNGGISATRKVSQVGYFMELVREGTNRRRWVWVDMDASGMRLDDVDFPWDEEDVRRGAVSRLHVKSNDFSIHEVAPTDDTVWGIVEASPFNYSANASGTLSVNGTTVKDVLGGAGWVDSHGTNGNADGQGGYGSFQVHRVFSADQKTAAGFWHDAETLFAWNRWGRNSGSSGDDAGIGPFFNHATASSSSRTNTADYTFSADAGAAGSMYEKVGAAAYSVRRLEIWVKQNPNGARILLK